MKTIDFQTEDGVALLTIDVKDRSMNVLTPEFIADLQEAIARVVSDDAIKGAVITSGKSSFIAGADLTELVAAFEQKLEPAQMYQYARKFQDLCRQLETCGKPLVAAINGTALGGGLEVCLACHYRVAADNPKSRLGLPEVTVGLLPGAGGTQRLPRLIGIEPALQLIIKGTHISPRDALEKGFVDEVVEPDKLVATARQALLDGRVDPVQPWDKKGFRVPGGAGLMNPKAIQTLMFGTALTARETNHNYPAPIAILSCVYEGTVLPIEAALEIETKYFTTLLLDPVSRNMIRSLFINKGAADKLVRRPQDVEKTRVTKLAVLGAGMMGAGIAYVSARAGMEVVLLDTTKEKAEFGKDYSRNLCDKGVKRGKLLTSAADSLLGRIHPTDNYADLDGCELVIEAVFEDRKIKAAVTEKTEAVIPPDSIFASNTSTLPITGLATASSRPEQFIGIHFFSPVDKMPLVEVILGEQTGDRATAVALDYIQQIRKTPIVVNDSRGFYTSRVFSTFTREGINLLAEGVNPALIENVAKQAGMPVGPLAVSDEVSLELAYHIGVQTKKDLGDAYQATVADDVLHNFVVQLERRGKRFGSGFYDYPDGGKKRLWPGLAEHYPLAAEQPTPEQIKQRLLHVQALDAVRCLEEGVLTDPEDGDIGSIFGWGFPPYTGGAISYIETLGLQRFVAECDELEQQHGVRFKVPPGLRELAAAGGSYYPPGVAGSRRSAA
ncbi:MAG: 3-hydroxyacyl-CoA dehydrogenase [Gammaproteobacteria bacterium]|nr:3-hydroxyacyl-CoA dehydrogenase [Gammaproteobacteria bacterium]